ncbi:malate dehydrogenase [Serinibacter salmoneus]|uniref:Malate dehydrogenase n=1 Tax=Serinibacter salmoneus TaxID=556530 RepID=A0A2A9CY21_9MICO|nr:malate dehydrogenase [Serinibacter salmoneus]PFG19036.1 malate dehydrogenase (NAD) [Serinibacter salmoneus]
MSTPAPLTLTLSGAAGQIGYSLLFRVASGEVFGPDQPVRIRMLEAPGAVRAAEGVAMELQDAAAPLVADVDISDQPRRAFDGADLAILVGARPRTAGMERADLLEVNAGIFGPQGEAINSVANEGIRVLVIGNPANTNTMIVAAHAPDVPRNRFSALTRLDHNRALAQLAARSGAPVGEISRVTIWGNHSRTQYPDVRHALIQGRPALEVVDREWAEGEFIDTVAQRGGAIIAARGGSSVASTATAIIDHVHRRLHGVREGDWSSAGRISDGSYGVPEGLVCSYPVISRDQEWEIVQGLEVDAFSRARIDASVAELIEEREAVRHLGLI